MSTAKNMTPLADRLRALPPEDRAAILDAVAGELGNGALHDSRSARRPTPRNTMITNEDRKTIQQTAIAQGVANSRQGALARAILAFDEVLSEGLPEGAGSGLTTRLEKLDRALAELPSAEDVEALQARLDRLEAELGAAPIEGD